MCLLCLEEDVRFPGARVTGVVGWGLSSGLWKDSQHECSGLPNHCSAQYLRLHSHVFDYFVILVWSCEVLKHFHTLSPSHKAGTQIQQYYQHWGTGNSLGDWPVPAEGHLFTRAKPLIEQIVFTFGNIFVEMLSDADQSSLSPDPGVAEAASEPGRHGALVSGTALTLGSEVLLSSHEEP